MPKIIKLKESDIHRMVKMVLNEQTTSSLRNMKILPVCDSKMKCKGELHVLDLKLEQGTDKECKVKFKYRLVSPSAEYPNAASIPIPKQGVGEKSCVRTGKKGKRSWNLKTDGYILNKGTASPYYFPSWDTEWGDFDTMCGTCKPNDHGPYKGQQKKEKLGRYEGGKKVGELNEQSFDADRYQETQDEGYGRLVKYLEFLTVKGVIDEGIMDEILGLAESYADDMWREGAQGGFADKYM